MADIEKIEIRRYYAELENDLEHLLNKYCRIMSWEVPEIDESKARALIFSALRDALSSIEGR